MLVIAKFDEICLKGNNKGIFIKKLADNLRRLFASASIKRIEGGIVIDNLTEVDLKILKYTPGIAKFAPAYVCKSEIDEIKKIIKEWPEVAKYQSFRLTATRADKEFPLNSAELNLQIGGYFNAVHGLKVNLKNPDLNVHLQVGKHNSYLFGNLVDGIGGLPIGSSGRVMCLLSGGLDSPVAAYTMMKRGAEVTLIHFQNQTAVTDEVSAKIIDLAKALACFQPGIKLLIIPFEPFQKEIIMKIPADYRMILSRRQMYKMAEYFAKREKCQALITGDSLGQVASQTLENMTAIYECVTMLKLSPLIGANKSEIMDLARQIGTHDISIRPYEDCCSLFVAKHPQTKASLKNVLQLALNLSPIQFDKIDVISYNIGMD